jgi:hypothetical protein
MPRASMSHRVVFHTIRFGRAAKTIRLLMPSFRKILWTCTFTVPSHRLSSRAIALFRNPRAASSPISRSRAVRLGRGSAVEPVFSFRPNATLLAHLLPPGITMIPSAINPGGAPHLRICYAHAFTSATKLTLLKYCTSPATVGMQNWHLMSGVELHSARQPKSVFPDADKSGPRGRASVGADRAGCKNRIVPANAIRTEMRPRIGAVLQPARLRPGHHGQDYDGLPVCQQQQHHKLCGGERASHGGTLPPTICGSAGLFASAREATNTEYVSPRSSDCFASLLCLAARVRARPWEN